MTIEAIIFYLLLLDSVSGNFVVLFGRRWYVHQFRILSRWFPPSQGWMLVYFILVLWVGSLLYRMGALGF